MNRQGRFIQRRLRALQARLPDGSRVRLGWQAEGWSSGWRITCTIPAEWEAHLDARIRDAHAANPILTGEEWVRWPAGLSLAGDSNLRRAFTKADAMVTDLLGWLACPTCGRADVNPGVYSGQIPAREGARP